MKRLHFFLLVLAAGCTVPGNELRIVSTSTSFALGKTIISHRVPDKTIVLNNDSYNDLDGVDQEMNYSTAVHFYDNTFLGSTIQSDGRVVATYKLGNAEGNRNVKTVISEKEERYWGQKLIIEPSNKIIQIVSSHFKGIPLAEFNPEIYIAGTGPKTGQVVLIRQWERLENINVKSASRLSQGNWKVIYANPKSKGTFTMIVNEGVEHTAPLEGGDGTVFLLNRKGWRYGREGLGGGSADYSFLEVKNKRGKFD